MIDGLNWMASSNGSGGSRAGEQFRIYLGIALVIAGAMQFRSRQSGVREHVEGDVVPAAPGARRPSMVLSFN